MAKRGRPPKKQEDRKGKMIAFRAEPDDIAVIEQAVAISGLNKSDWIRGRLLHAAKREIKASQFSPPSIAKSH